jgi:flagellar basal-body rod modification protein FlgD
MDTSYRLQSLIPSLPSTLRTSDPEKENPQEEFIKLMVAQLQNQDPDNPVDGTALISQLAQMNAAVAMQSMSYLSKENHAVATSTALLGKKVLVQDKDTGAQVSGPVTTVDYTGKRPMVVVNNRAYPIESVVRVDQ